MDVLIKLLKTFKNKIEDVVPIEEDFVTEEETLSGIPYKMLPKLKTPEEKMNYFLKKIKEIGPISKYSAIEED